MAHTLNIFKQYLFIFRFEEMFPDVGIVREVQQELDTVIEEGVINIVNLLKYQVSPSVGAEYCYRVGSYQHSQPTQESG